MIFKKLRHSGEVPGGWKRGTSKSIWELLAQQPHFYAWEGHGMDPSRSSEVHVGQGGDSRQPVQLHQRQVITGKTNPVALNDGITPSVEKESYHLSGLL